jgi:hypothetical protein
MDSPPHAALLGAVEGGSWRVQAVTVNRILWEISTLTSMEIRWEIVAATARHRGC